MTQAKISVLKDRLSHYLGLVKRGQTVLVLDRDRVIARIEPAGARGSVPTADAAWLDELERAGVVRRAVKPLPRGWPSERVQVKADVLGALLAERAEGR